MIYKLFYTSLTINVELTSNLSLQPPCRKIHSSTMYKISINPALASREPHLVPYTGVPQPMPGS